MRQVTHNYQKEAFVLKLDIASYFRSIPKEKLWGKIEMLLSPSSRTSESSRGGERRSGIQDITTRSEHLFSEKINRLDTAWIPAYAGMTESREREREYL